MDDNNLNNQRQDDYLACNLYKGKTASPEGIYKFTEEGKFYFSFMENGNVILRSEGYTNEAGRENGIKSVLNNIEDENLHKVLKLNDGTWVVVLNAGNHQEIARSCPFNTEAEALGLFPVARAAARAALLLTATPIAAAAIPKINNIDKRSTNSLREVIMNIKYPKPEDYPSDFNECPYFKNQNQNQIQDIDNVSKWCDILQLEHCNSRNAGKIKKAYKKLALQLHPDKNKHTNIDTTEQFQQLGNAYVGLLKLCETK